ncbi:hypothetical protein VTK56DRAFT_714 [Thermocarpiscus australiensis]
MRRPARRTRADARCLGVVCVLKERCRRAVAKAAGEGLMHERVKTVGPLTGDLLGSVMGSTSQETSDYIVYLEVVYHRVYHNKGGTAGSLFGREKRMEAVGVLADGALQDELSTAFINSLPGCWMEGSRPRLHSTSTQKRKGENRGARDASDAMTLVNV